ncbi:MAG: TetR/AcrR family transcriptional regulator [Actinomycetota bacterium]|nr:TetR/AcrR family transcriptional regulator [Actinomycetota bacterium]
MTDNHDTRGRILLEAAALFSANGFNGTSMSELAAAVGITKSSLYHHFPSKQALLAEIIEVTVSRVTPLVQKVAEMDLPASDRLRRAIVLHTVEAIRDQDAIACFVEEGRYLEREFMETHVVKRDAYEQVFRKLFEDGIESGEFVKRDIGIAVKAVLGMCNSVVRWYKPDGDYSAQEIADEFADFAVRGASVTGGDR